MTVLAILVAVLCVSYSQVFRVDNMNLQPTGIVFRVESDTNHYYVLDFGVVMSNLSEAVNMSLGEDAHCILRDLARWTTTPKGFYRVRRYSLAEPRDHDGDGMDDVFELLRPPLDPVVADATDTDGDGIPDKWENGMGMNPSNATDAAGDRDRDGYPNIYEYRGHSRADMSNSIPAPTLYVDGTASSRGGRSTAATFTTIQAALDAAANYDIIQVADGTYGGPGNKNLLFRGKPVVLCAASGPPNCVIDSGGSGRAILFNGGEDARCVVLGLTIQGGFNGDGGAGILCVGSSPVVHGCLIRDNHTYHSEGAAVYAVSSGMAMRQCTVISNSSHGSYRPAFSATLGTNWIEDCHFEANQLAVHNEASELFVTRSQFLRNSRGAVAADQAGSYPDYRYARTTLENCVFLENRGQGGTIEDNQSTFGGAGGKLTVRNCTVVDNVWEGTNPDGAGISFYIGAVEVHNSILWGNRPNQISDTTYNTLVTVAHSLVEGGWPGAGNLDAPPGLVNEYVLRPDSPCIDAGSASNAPPYDHEGEARWDDPDHTNVVSIVDIGADEFVDTDHDHMADSWERHTFGDLSRDGTADSDAVGGPDGVTDAEEFAAGTDPDNADSDGDGLLDGAEVKTHGTSPLDADTDGDGMPDGYEVQQALNPLDAVDAMHDPDWDGIANVYEYAHGTHPHDPVETPDPTVYVDAAAPFGGDGSAAAPFNKIGRALEVPAAYTIVQIADGLYQGFYNVPINAPTVPVMLTSTGDAANCIVDAGNSDAMTFGAGRDQRTLIAGLTIRAGHVTCTESSPSFRDCVFRDYDGSAQGGALYGSGAAPRLVRCTFFNNRTTSRGGAVCFREESRAILQRCVFKGNRAGIDGGALYAHASRVSLQNCLIADNRADGTGGGIEGWMTLGLTNCILWGNRPNQIDNSDTTSVSRCTIQGGWPGTGNLDADPQLAPGFRLAPTSPCIDAGTASNAPATDIEGEAPWDDPDHSNIVSIVDIGADEFVDTDGDDLADRWEHEHYGDLSPDGTTDNDADGGPDGLTQAEEYLNGTDPQKADTDGDGLNDGDEVKAHGTDPLDADSDGDRMNDGWEVEHGLNPLYAMDARFDTDGDRIPTYYEYVLGTIPTNATSAPAATYHVNPAAPAGGDGSAALPFSAIQTAIDAAGDHDIVALADGTYRGVGNRDIQCRGKALLLYSTNGAEQCVIDCEDADRGFNIRAGEDWRTMIKGVTVRNASDRGLYLDSATSPTVSDCVIAHCQGGGVYINGGDPAFLNCTFAHNEADRGGAIYLFGSLTLLNCTLAGNVATDDPRYAGGGIYNGGPNGHGVNLLIANSILWTNLPGQIHASWPNRVSVTHSDIQSGWAGAGNLDVDPRLTRRGRLHHDSPCIDAGGASNAPPHDADREARWDDPDHTNAVSVVDMGADEFIDTDDDDLSDAWERRYLGGLGQTGAEDIDADGGPDGLTNLEEYERGTHPARADTDGDGLLDGTEANATGTDPLDADSDDDWLSDGWEVQHGFDPLDAANSMQDPDADLFPNYYEFTHGSIPTNPASVPAATLHVDGNAPPGGDGSSTDPLDTIQGALDAATSGDIIRVADGTYTGTGNKNLDYNGKALMLYGANGASNCIIDCENSGRGAGFADGEDRRTVLSGIGIHNGGSQSYSGGGLRCVGASPTILRCHAVTCGADGMYFGDSSALVLGCTVMNGSGTGIKIFRATPMIEDCVIDNNGVWGLYVDNSFDDTDTIVRRCSVTGNSGGGIYWDSPTLPVVLEDCDVMANGQSVYGRYGSGFFVESGGGDIRNCRFSNNEGIGVSYASSRAIETTFIACEIRGNQGGGFDVPGSVRLTLRNCVIADNRSPQGVGGMSCDEEIVLQNCTIAGNSGAEFGGLQFGMDEALLRNCIVWGNTPGQITHGGPATYLTVDHSCVEGGWTGTGNIADDPQLTRDYELNRDSPCIDAGSASNAPPRDIHDEVRWDDPRHSNAVSIVDMGADEFVDTDGDYMADSWERRHFGDLSRDGSADNDSDGGPDGLTDLDEYEQGSDPNRADTDGDGLRDGEEVNTYRTSPADADTDGDFMPDKWELDRSLDPLDASDIMGDPDGDRFGNVYEFGHGTDPHAATSAPAATLFVDAGAAPGGDGTVTHPLQTIQGALDIAEDYDIIQIADGLYTGPANRDLSMTAISPAVMLTSTGHASACVIDCEGQARGLLFSGSDARCVVRGLTVRDGYAYGGGGAGILCSLASPMIENCIITANEARHGPGRQNPDNGKGGGIFINGGRTRLRGCLVAGNSASRDGGGIWGQGPTVIENCTIVDNTATVEGGGVAASTQTVVRSCIVWGNTPNQLNAGASTSGVSYCDVQGGWTGTGNIDSDPMLTPNTYRLKGTSPCIDAGSAGGASARDMDGENAWDDPDHADVVSTVDMGADEFVDTDNDGMADAWERRHFTDLSRDGTGNADGDAHTDLAEYENGTDPNTPD
jgi:hypothetical protein